MSARASASCGLIGAAVLLLLASCKGAPPPAPQAPPPTAVEVATVTRASVIDRFDAVGTISAGEQVTVVSEVDGIVAELPFAEGQAIAKGALIAQIRDSEWRAQLTRAEAVREQARITAERVRKVVEQGIGSSQDEVNANAALHVADADVAVMTTRLAKAQIRAPFGGIIGSRRVSPGAYVHAGDPIVDLAAVDEVKVRFAAPEKYLATLARGTDVTIGTAVFPGENLAGQISVVDPVLEKETRNAWLTARVKNPQHKLRPGMSANVSVVLAERAQALIIPSEAVFFEGNQALVFVVNRDNAVARRAVTLGTRQSATVEVLTGLDVGETVVRTGHQKLWEGAHVAAAPPPSEPAAKSTPATGAAH